MISEYPPLLLSRFKKVRVGRSSSNKLEFFFLESLSYNFLFSASFSFVDKVYENLKEVEASENVKNSIFLGAQFETVKEQAGAELGQAQVQID